MKLTELYKSLNDRALNEQETEEEKFKEDKPQLDDETKSTEKTE